MADGLEEDPFGEYLQQDEMAVDQAAPVDAGAQLKLLVESSQRQEELLGKMCSLLLGLDEKVGQVAASQNRLDVMMEQIAEGGAAGRSSSFSGGRERGSSFQASGRGNMPGGGPGGERRPGPGQGPAPDAYDAEKLAAERQRIEEENKQRAAQLAKKKEEAEKRAKEEAERQRIDEERRREEEKARKANLEKKTTGLMSDLVSSSGGGGLFGDDLPKKKKGGGLFDDD